jgi:hypothetical protein
VAAHAGADVRVALRLLPLPYHRAAFDLARAALALKALAPPASVRAFLDAAFARQGEILDGAIAHTPPRELPGVIYGWLRDAGVAPEREAYEAAVGSREVEMAARCVVHDHAL